MSSPEWTEAQAAEIRRAVEAMKGRPPFSGAHRLHRLLAYVVDAELEGEGAELNQARLAIDVLDRGSDFDAGCDAIVRVEVGRLRAKVLEYYAGAGAADTVRIALPKGRYRPQITFRAPAREPEPAPDVGARREWIAVLPFANLNRRDDDDPLAAGFHEEMITQLAKISGLKVISRTSTLQFKDTTLPLPRIAQVLGVGHVLEGSIRRADRTIRVTAQLIEAATDTHVWAETFDTQLTDILEIQARVARAIAASLHTRLTRQEEAVLATPAMRSFEAYELYQRAQRGLREFIDAYFMHDRRILHDAVRSWLDEALALDPTLQAAYVARARLEAHYVYRGYDLPGDRRDGILADATRAAELSPLDGMAHLALGDHALKVARDPDTAIAYYEQARAQMPGDVRPLLVLAQAYHDGYDFERELEMVLPALRFDPLNRDIRHRIEENHLMRGRWSAYLTALAEREDHLRSSGGLTPEFAQDIRMRRTLAHFQMTGRLEIDGERIVFGPQPAGAPEPHLLGYYEYPELHFFQLALYHRRYDVLVQALEQKFDAVFNSLPSLRVPAFHYMAELKSYEGRPEVAAYFSERALDFLEREFRPRMRAGDERQEAEYLYHRGLALAGCGDDGAFAAFEEVTQLGDPWEAARAVIRLAQVHAWRGHVEAAVDHASRAIQLSCGCLHAPTNILYHPAYDPVRASPAFVALMRSRFPEEAVAEAFETQRRFEASGLLSRVFKPPMS